MLTKPLDATIHGAQFLLLCAASLALLQPCFAEAPTSSSSAIVVRPLTEPSSSHTRYHTKAGKPVRMKARLQYDDTAPLAGGVGDGTAAAPRPTLDHDLYMRELDDSIPGTYQPGSSWNQWTRRILDDVHALIERDLNVPGYADLVVTVQQDGRCTATFANLMGGPQFEQRAHAFIGDLNASKILHFPQENGRASIRFKLGAGAFYPNKLEGHFWCGVGGEIPNAAAQLKERYSKYHE